MKERLLEPLPETFALSCGVALTTIILLLALTRLRGTKLAPLAAINLTVVLLWSTVLGLFEPPPLRVQVVIVRLVELPLVSGIAILCVTQARRLTPSSHRLRVALLAAPALLLCAWVLAFIGEQVWPRPTLDPFAEMPVRNWALLTVLCAPFQFYLWCLAFLFARAAGPRTPTRRLRLQNLSLALAIGGYGLVSLNVVAGYAVQAFLDDPSRREITLVQILIEERLFFIWGPALLLGLLLAASTVAFKATRLADALTVLPMRERFEGLAWRLEATGALRRLTRPLYHLGTAAYILNLTEGERAKATQTVKLAAVMSSPKAPAGVSRDKAAELLARLEAVYAPPPILKFPLIARRQAPQPVHLNAAYLSDVLDAALELSGPGTGAGRENQPAWFELAREACVEAGIVRPAECDNRSRETILDAYRTAAS